MSTLQEIKAPVEEHIRAFEEMFKNSMKSEAPLLDKITRYIVRRKGKQVRPLFVFFSAGIFGEIDQRTYRAASLIELLHTATLIHDDVVDDSSVRRGFFSLNALWKNKISVLVGDYLLSRGLLLSMEYQDCDLLQIVARSVKEMSEGELMQMEKARNLSIDEDVYFEIIRKKTASLIASCLCCGAASAGASKEDLELMYEIGIQAGVAFQIKDDIMDFDPGTDKGKPSGADIKERKMTLPLIYVINNASYAKKRKIINIVKNHSHDEARVRDLMNMVREEGGIDYATGHMEAHRDKAVQMLERLPNNPARDSLRKLIDFSVKRDS